MCLQHPLTLIGTGDALPLAAGGLAPCSIGLPIPQRHTREVNTSLSSTNLCTALGEYAEKSDWSLLLPMPSEPHWTQCRMSFPGSWAGRWGGMCCVDSTPPSCCGWGYSAPFSFVLQWIKASPAVLTLAQFPLFSVAISSQKWLDHIVPGVTFQPGICPAFHWLCTKLHMPIVLSALCEGQLNIEMKLKQGVRLASAVSCIHKLGKILSWCKSVQLH